MSLMAVERVPIQQQIELAEAVIELAMARHASIPKRGFDSDKQRAKLHEQIDKMLDELAFLRLQAALEGHLDTPAPGTTSHLG